MENKQTADYQIRELKLSDGEQVHELLRHLHIGTYTNDELGVTADKINKRFTKYNSTERRERLEARINDPTSNSWVAVDNHDKVIGMAAAMIEEDGTRRLRALYVDTQTQGQGVATAMMKQALAWLGDEHDIVLSVVAYNGRAKRFYQKWGFEEVPGSESMFDDLIPEVDMKKGRA